MSKAKAVTKQKKKHTPGMNGAAPRPQNSSSRIAVKKTYKLYINGAFPRTESGHSYPVFNKKKEVIAQLCRSSRKDFRECVVSNRACFPKWSSISAFLRSQIMYRIAEMLESRREQFASELLSLGSTPRAAQRELDAAIDTLVYYAGWSDKYQQVFSCVNPVASSHFNFSIAEPVGVVSVVAPEDSGFLGLIRALTPVITGGNTCTVLASEQKALCAMSFAEVLHSSDVPAGTVNILTGKRDELIEHMSTHMDVNALLIYDGDKQQLQEIDSWACSNLKRVIKRSSFDSMDPYQILDTQEIKTTWHPIGA